MATHAIVPHKNKNAIAIAPYEKKNLGTKTVKDRKETSSVLQVVSEQFQDETIERLTKLERSINRTRLIEANLGTRIGHLEDKVALHALAEQLRKNHEQLKQTRKENAKEKNKGSTWNRMKKMVSKDGIENKYIVD